MVAERFDSAPSYSSKQKTMKSYFKTLALVSICFYALVSFVSFEPNPYEWNVGGRGAFAFFSIIIAIVIDVAFNEYNKEYNKTR